MFKRNRILYQLNKKYISPSERATLKYQNYTKNQRRNNLIGKYVQYIFLSLVGGSVLGYMWQPWNPYSKEVSKKLRKGLWEEREGKDDHLTALKYYQEALKVAKDDENMNQLSLKYTGIVLKMAEMYENLKINDKVISTYFNLSTFIFENLIHGNISKNNIERDLLIDRDLIVITRWAELMQELKPKNWVVDVNNELQDRIAYIENTEIQYELPWTVDNHANKNKKILTEELIDIWLEGRNSSFNIDLPIKSKWIEQNIESEDGKEFLKCWNILRSLKGKIWPEWIESYLRMRDFYAMFQMRLGNLGLCIQILQSNLLWSSIAGFQDTVNGTTQILNLASAWFQLGQLNNDFKSYQTSRIIYEKLIASLKENDPILPMSYYSLGVLFLQLNDKKMATENFSRAKDLAIEMNQLQIVDKIDDELLKSLNLKM